MKATYQRLHPHLTGKAGKTTDLGRSTTTMGRYPPPPHDPTGTQTQNPLRMCVYSYHFPGRLVQPVTCLATGACLNADPGVASLNPAQSHTLVEVDHEIFLWSFSSFPLNNSGRFVVSYKRKCVHKVLVNPLFELAQDIMWLGELTVSS